jgi:putative addiction module component (TIGR02574 family)
VKVGRAIGAPVKLIAGAPLLGSIESANLFRMQRTLEQIEREALKLPEEDRLALGERLLQSVPTDPAIQEAWDAEIARRVDDIESGKITGIQAEEVEAELQKIVS